MKNVWVISLGGSLVVPKEMDLKFLHKFKKEINKHTRKNKFVLVIGGGTIARKYISALQMEHSSQKGLSMAGIRATRMNAEFIMQFFGKKVANDTLPLNMKSIKNDLAKNDVVVCGALRFVPRSTSDGTAASLAKYLKTSFINLTNVSGLYTADPKKDKKAKLIKNQTWKEFENRTLKVKNVPGMHFVLDQRAAKEIRKNKITTYIVGKETKELANILKNKPFKGTIITG